MQNKHFVFLFGNPNVRGGVGGSSALVQIPNFYRKFVSGALLGRIENNYFSLKIEGVSMLLGGWWLSMAAQGLVENIPVINTEPLMEGESRSPKRRARISDVDSTQEIGSKSPTRRIRLHGSGTSSKMSTSSGLSNSSRFSNSS